MKKHGMEQKNKRQAEREPVRNRPTAEAEELFARQLQEMFRAELGETADEPQPAPAADPAPAQAEPSRTVRPAPDAAPLDDSALFRAVEQLIRDLPVREAPPAAPASPAEEAAEAPAASGEAPSPAAEAFEPELDLAELIRESKPARPEEAAQPSAPAAATPAPAEPPAAEPFRTPASEPEAPAAPEDEAEDAPAVLAGALRRWSEKRAARRAAKAARPQAEPDSAPAETPAEPTHKRTKSSRKAAAAQDAEPQAEALAEPPTADSDEAPRRDLPVSGGAPAPQREAVQGLSMGEYPAPAAAPRSSDRLYLSAESEPEQAPEREEPPALTGHPDEDWTDAELFAAVDGLLARDRFSESAFPGTADRSAEPAPPRRAKPARPDARAMRDTTRRVPDVAPSAAQPAPRETRPLPSLEELFPVPAQQPAQAAAPERPAASGNSPSNEAPAASRRVPAPERPAVSRNIPTPERPAAAQTVPAAERPDAAPRLSDTRAFRAVGAEPAPLKRDTLPSLAEIFPAQPASEPEAPAEAAPQTPASTPAPAEPEPAAAEPQAVLPGEPVRTRGAGQKKKRGWLAKLLRPRLAEDDRVYADELSFDYADEPAPEDMYVRAEDLLPDQLPLAGFQARQTGSGEWGLPNQLPLDESFEPRSSRPERNPDELPAWLQEIRDSGEAPADAEIPDWVKNLSASDQWTLPMEPLSDEETPDAPDEAQFGEAWFASSAAEEPAPDAPDLAAEAAFPVPDSREDSYDAATEPERPARPSRPQPAAEEAYGPEGPDLIPQVRMQINSYGPRTGTLHLEDLLAAAVPMEQAPPASVPGRGVAAERSLRRRDETVSIPPRIPREISTVEENPAGMTPPQARRPRAEAKTAPAQTGRAMPAEPRQTAPQPERTAAEAPAGKRTEPTEEARRRPAQPERSARPARPQRRAAEAAAPEDESRSAPPRRREPLAPQTEPQMNPQRPAAPQMNAQRPAAPQMNAQRPAAPQTNAQRPAAPQANPQRPAAPQTPAGAAPVRTPGEPVLSASARRVRRERPETALPQENPARPRREALTRPAQAAQKPAAEAAVLHPEEAYRKYVKELSTLGGRIVVTGLFTLLCLFLTLYLNLGWKFLPEIFSGGTSVYLMLAMLIGMVLTNHSLFTDALRSLIRRPHSVDLLLVPAAVFTALDTIRAAEQPRPQFAVVIGLLLLLSLWGKYDRYMALTLTVRQLREKEAEAGVAEVQDITKGSRGLMRTEPDAERFMQKLETRDLCTRAMSAYVPVALFVGLAITLLIHFGLRLDLFWTGSLIFLGCVPLAGLLVFPRLFRMLSLRLSDAGAALCGWHGAEVFGGEHSILIGDDDIFPAGSLRLNGFKVYSGAPERIIAYAAAASRRSVSALSPLFEDLLRTHVCRRYTVDTFRYYDSGGIGATIIGDVVLMGSLDFMRHMGVHMDKGTKVRQAVYLSINGELAAVFAVKYAPPENLRRGLAAIAGNRHFKGILVTRTFLGTPGFLKAKFGIPTGSFAYPATKERLRLSETRMKDSGDQGAILTEGGFSGFARAAAGGRILRSATVAGTVLALVNGVVGLLLTTVLAVLPAYGSATALNILLYIGAWTVPTLLLTAWARRI